MNNKTLALLILGIYQVWSSQFENKIYKTLSSFAPCILLTNATHQIGCTSDFNGNVGVVHLIKNDSQLDWLIDKGPNAPYVPLISAYMFNDVNMQKLMKSKKISGALVIFTDTERPAEFSPDSQCPSTSFGRYHNNSDYSNCKKVKWNTKGNDMAFKFYGIPILAMQNSSEVAYLEECYSKHNLAPQAYPLCAVQMKYFMFACKNTPTCKRKSERDGALTTNHRFCDPLEDYNVVGTLQPQTGDLKTDDVIVVSAKLDSTSFFHNVAHGADTEVSGLVVLLAVAQALGHYMRTVGASEKLKPVMFVFFNGEVFDYIGSSRMVYDMERGVFPHEDTDSTNSSDINEAFFSKMNLSHIDYFIELSQLGLGENETIFAHSDPISLEDNTMKKKVDKLTSILQSSATAAGLKIKEVPQARKQPLPKASLQRFLRRRSIPGIVLADHEMEFTNKYYNSRFDDAYNLGVEDLNGTAVSMKSELEHLRKVSEAVANSIYKLASSGREPEQPITVNKNITSGLTYCLLFSANCSAFKEGLPEHMSEKLKASGPYNRYISVNDYRQPANPVTQIVNSLLGYYLGSWFNKTLCDSNFTSYSYPRGVNGSKYAVSYYTVAGRGFPVCVQSTSRMTLAISPAFDLKEYDSTEYSTWAESIWSESPGIQVFLQADPQFEGAILGCGLLLTLLSFGGVYIGYSRSSIIFTPHEEIAPSLDTPD